MCGKAIVPSNGIILRLEDGDKVMEIGNQNIIEVGASEFASTTLSSELSNRALLFTQTKLPFVPVIHAPTIGNNNVLHVQCEVSPNSCVSNGCSIGVRCKLFTKETLPERTVIYGKFNERRVANDNPPVRLDLLSNRVLFIKP